MVIDFLYEERIPVLIEGSRQPISESVKRVFDAYLSLYGTIT